MLETMHRAELQLEHLCESVTFLVLIVYYRLPLFLSQQTGLSVISSVHPFQLPSYSPRWPCVSYS